MKSSQDPGLLSIFFFSLLVIIAGPRTGDAQTDWVSGRMIQFNDNGAWSWFEDERAIVDAENGLILASTTADGSGALGRNGGTDVATFDLTTGRTQRFSLNGNIQADDHNTAALLKMDDGRYLAAYANHGTDRVTRSRTSTHPGDSSSWNSEVTRTNIGSTTYNNLFQLSGESGRIYNFTRTNNWDPNLLVSDDNGASWQAGGNLIRTSSGSIRPYVKYTSNEVDQIHFINTENHPRNFDNSVYHGYIQSGQVFDSFGNVIDSQLDSVGIASNAGSRIFQGDADNVAWVSDIHLDSSGNPVVAFTVQKDSAGLSSGHPDAGQDHRYHYARFDGNQWNHHEIAFAGSRLYAGEDDYTGNIAINPDNTNEVYISTNVDPATGNALISTADGQRHWEIFKGQTADNGATWTWNAVTQNSTVDNLRPIVPKWDSQKTALLWMRGDYTSYTNYNLAVVGTVEDPNEPSGPIEYFDADTTNTTRVDGLTWDPTSGTGQGLNEGRWHIRSEFGNNGTVITSNERAGSTEDAPMLETTISQSGEAGLFDVYAYFWSNKNEDWEVIAGLDLSDMDYFQKQAAEHANSDEFLTSVIATSNSGNEYMYQAYLGRVFLAEGDFLTVYFDDGAGGTGRRTWYDGIGLARISSVPEPGTGLALALFLIAGIRHRRR